MINTLTGIGFGIIGFAVLIGVGLVLLSSLGSSVASCPTGFTYAVNISTGTCCLDTVGATSMCSGATNSTTPSTATSNINTIAGYLGTSSGGLTTWIPVIIVLVIGLLFLGAFMTRKGMKA